LRRRGYAATAAQALSLLDTSAAADPRTVVASAEAASAHHLAGDSHDAPLAKGPDVTMRAARLVADQVGGLKCRLCGNQLLGHPSQYRRVSSRSRSRARHLRRIPHPLSSRPKRSEEPGRRALILQALPEIATRLSGRRVAAAVCPDLSPG
jgi:hypothetical protein